MAAQPCASSSSAAKSSYAGQQMTVGDQRRRDCAGRGRGPRRGSPSRALPQRRSGRADRRQACRELPGEESSCRTGRILLMKVASDSRISPPPSRGEVKRKTVITFIIGSVLQSHDRLGDWSGMPLTPPAASWPSPSRPVRDGSRRGAGRAPGRRWPAWRRRTAAALAAPASPMAKVATGIPFGICTIESSES
jgi:hypothetical protein